MRAIKFEVFVLILAVSTSAVATAQAVPEVRMVAIEGGNYPIGSAEGPASTRPSHRVSLSPFLIDAEKWRQRQGTRSAVGVDLR